MSITPALCSCRGVPFCVFALAFGALLRSEISYGANYFGRAMVGAYLSSEKFADPSDGMNLNNFATISSRLYTRVSELTSNRLELTTDLRDKHDFFDKLDAERLQLTGANKLQLRQLSLKNENGPSPFTETVGRFSIPDAGAVNVDGGLVGYRWTRTFNTSVFGGLNPMRPDQSSMTFNSDSDVYGLDAAYQPRSENWNRSFFLNNALVTQIVQGHTDRRYFYTNAFYQWQRNCQILWLTYVDFVPKFFMQTGLISWRQQSSPTFLSTTNLTSIDTLEYSRRRGVLELLQPSGYREGSWAGQKNVTQVASLNFNFAYGYRTADHLKRLEISAGPSWSQIWGNHFSARGLLGYRDNFTTKDTFGRGGLGYFSKSWETDVDLEYDIRRQTTGVVNHDVIAEISVARYFSKAVYGTFALQEAKNERVAITSAFIKLGYRFGSQDIPPVRDGAPPVGGKL